MALSGLKTTLWQEFQWGFARSEGHVPALSLNQILRRKESKEEESEDDDDEDEDAAAPANPPDAQDDEERQDEAPYTGPRLVRTRW